MIHYQYPIMGAILGAIHGLILWAAKTTLSSIFVPVSPEVIGMAPTYITAFSRSEVIYNSVLIAGVVDVVIIITVISSVWWIPKLETVLQVE